MKRKIPDRNGMETPISMMFLVMAALLIAGILDYLSPSASETDHEFDIRCRQVDAMGSVLIEWYPEILSQEMRIKVVESGNESVHLWNGSNLTCISGPDHLDKEILLPFFQTTPDDLPCVLFQNVDNNESIEISGSYVTWSAGDDVYSITLMLPIHRNSMEIDYGVVG
jgi:hypothetical protein